MDLAVSWSRDRVVISSTRAIHVWSLKRQEELLRISMDLEPIVRSVEFSEDTKILNRGMTMVPFFVGT